MRRIVIGSLLVACVLTAGSLLVLRNRWNQVSKEAGGQVSENNNAVVDSLCSQDISIIVSDFLTCYSNFAKVDRNKINMVTMGFLADSTGRRLWCRIQFGGQQVIIGEIAEPGCYKVLSRSHDSIQGLCAICPALEHGVSIDGMFVVVRDYRSVLLQYYGIESWSVIEPDLNSTVLHIARESESREDLPELFRQQPEELNDLPGPASTKTFKFKVKQKQVK